MVSLKKDKLKKNRLILIGSFFIILGISIITNKIFYNYNLQKEEKLEIKKYYEEITITPNEDDLKEEEQNNKVNEDKISTPPKQFNYVAILKIPKINLKKGLYDKSNTKNNVNYGIQILKESSYPNEENGNLILAGHSGTGRIAFFKNLYKMNVGDEVIVNYKGVDFKYKIINIYDVIKGKKVNIRRNLNKKTLTLITCKYKTNMQTVYIAEQI